jgi:gamma-glutamyltranspeptidase/glutathione hydrolase
MAKGAVAAGHALTAEAAREILRAGGTAVDAAIAGVLMACVAEPVLASPGGAGFFAIAEAPRRILHLDAFAQTPKAGPAGDEGLEEVEADFGTARQRFVIGSSTSATPGLVPGLFAAHERFGRIPMRDLAAPAITVARTGVVLTPFQAEVMRIVAPILMAHDTARALFAPDGKLLVAGQTFRNPDLADAIEAIASEGVRIVTEGEIARAMLASVEGGRLTGADLSTYRPEWRESLRLSVARTEVFLNPPPAAGGALVKAMFVEQAKQAARGAAARLQAMQAVDRNWKAAQRDLERFLAREGQGRATAARGTTHISVVDAQGRAAAVSLSNGEGNGRIVPGCGFMLNNMLGEDDVNPRGPLEWRPGMRLASMMSPGLAVTREGAVLAFGSGGSNRIRSALYQVLHRHFAEGASLEEAVLAPRAHVEEGRVDFEDFEEDEAWRDLHLAVHEEARRWPAPSLYFGGVHAVRRDPRGGLSGIGDPRREGVFLVA